MEKAFFEDCGTVYKWQRSLPKDSKKSDISLELKDNIIEMQYLHKSRNSFSGTSDQVRVPDDAIFDTITAKFVDHVLIVQVDKVQKPESTKDKCRKIEIE